MRWVWDHSIRLAAFVGLGGLWLLDISDVVRPNDLENGFWSLSAERGFHWGLWTAIVAFLFVGIKGR